MHEFYPTESFLQVLFVTGVLGGGAAWLTGRAIALTWRPLWHAIAYVMLLGCAVRFIHFALFQAALLAVPSYFADTVFLILIACLSWQFARTTQMVTQYKWLYRRTSPLTWGRRAPADQDRRAP
jgi:uncharacterized protein DUF6867